MRSRTPSPLPESIERVQRRFERWRRLGKTKGRSRIPEALWRAAVELAGEHGTYKAARALRLDYQGLKSRLSEPTRNGLRRGVPRGSAFVELLPATVTDAAECVVELEDRRGSKMRIHLKGGAPPDLASLTRAFCGTEA